jgi:hypothetical protein
MTEDQEEQKEKNLQNYSVKFLTTSPFEIKEMMIKSGCKSVRMLDIAGEREVNDEEWIILVGEVG